MLQKNVEYLWCKDSLFTGGFMKWNCRYNKCADNIFTYDILFFIHYKLNNNMEYLEFLLWNYNLVSFKYRGMCKWYIMVYLNTNCERTAQILHWFTWYQISLLLMSKDPKGQGKHITLVYLPHKTMFSKKSKQTGQTTERSKIVFTQKRKRQTAATNLLMCPICVPLFLLGKCS